MAVPARPADEVRYPESDRVPVGETETHYDAIMDLVHQLRVHFRRQHDVHVSANQFWYFEEGNPRSVVCPDVYVVFGVPQIPPRDIWKTWEDHCFPSVIFEFTSRKTRRIDTGFKPGLYEKLGADELWLFDPLGDYLEPRFQGWRRDAGRFVRVDPDPSGRFFDSLALQSRLHVDGSRVVATRGGVEVPPLLEMYEQLEAARALGQRAEQEALRADREALRADRLAERLRQLGIPDDD